MKMKKEKTITTQKQPTKSPKVKIVIGAIAILTLIGAFSGCAGPDEEQSKSTISEETGSIEEITTEESSAEDTQTSVAESSSETTVETSSSTTTLEVTFEEITVVDNDECAIKITEIDPDNMWGYTLKVNLENKSTDKTYMFSVTNAAVNGVQSDPLFATEVAPGKKANDEITFMDSSLEENGITDFTDIEISFRVYDSDDWTADAVAETNVHVYPYGQENATNFVREPQSSDNVIIDNDYVTVTIIGYENDDIWGYTINLFLVNKSDKNIMFSIQDASVNGYMADPFYADSVSAGKCAFSSISWSDSVFEENSITEIEQIEFLFKAYNDDDWMADDFVNQVVTLNP